MDVTSKLKPIMNQRGFYVIMDTEGNDIPEELANQVWTSEREATFSINAYLSKQANKEVTEEKE